jgi:AcrR family transcriptional regulator
VPKLAEKYTDFRKQQILEAAWECFVEKGYRDTTMREIARRLDATTGVIYTYFQGKDQILEAILSESLERNRQRFVEAGRKLGDAGVVQQLLSSYLECCPVAVLKQSAQGNLGLWSEALKQDRIGGVVSSYLGGLRDSIAGMVRSSIEAGQLPAGLEPEAVAGFYLAFYLGLEVQLALVAGWDSPRYIDSIKKVLSRLSWSEAEEKRDPPPRSGRTTPPVIHN